MKAALLDSNNDVIGEVFDAPETGYSIEIAGDFTVNGDPVNVQTMKISRSARNMKKAAYEQPISKIGSVYTFACVEDGRACY